MLNALSSRPAQKQSSRIWGALAFGVSVFLGAGSSAWAVTAAELGQTWANGSGSVSSTDWNELLAVFREDSETNELLGDIQRRMGAANPEAIARIVQLCPDLPGRTAGHFAYRSQYFDRSQSSPNVTQDFGTEAAAARSRGIASQVERRATVDRLTVASVDKVCIRPGMSLLDSFGVMVHELTHFRGWEAMKEVDVLDFADERDFAEKEVLVPGGELEAYTAQGRALCRLEQRTGVHSNDTMMGYFNSECELANRPGLIRNILDSRGYRGRFESEFRQKVAQAKTDAARSLQFNRGRLLPNIEHNAQIPGANQQFYRDYVTRIQAEIERIEDRIAELDRRFPGL